MKLAAYRNVTQLFDGLGVLGVGGGGGGGEIGDTGSSIGVKGIP